ncbi:MAG: serine hydroxymethyltransferase [Deltaproteobacteria bacterium]|nr:MAG: serine hydroxymethyltransferase [Deltaproteobacteria bacterium]
MVRLQQRGEAEPRSEEQRQVDKLRLIPSENYVSEAVLAATGSVLTNKYSEGYAGRRYYEGQQYIDQIEKMARERAKELFGSETANVQPYSGSPANLAALFAFCQPHDPIMGMGLPHGGHLTHGWNVSITGAYFKAAQYGVHPETHLIDYDAVRKLAQQHRPKVIFAGATAYPRIIDFAAFAEIAKEVEAIFVADIAHISGLVAAGVHPSPVPHADAVTTTTHKTLRGPRGGLILMRKKHRKKINNAVFPGLQGGPHNHTTAAIAVALREAATDEFKRYAQQIVDNSKALADELNSLGYRLVSGGTDNHLLIVDVTKKPDGSDREQRWAGKIAAQALDRAGMVCNYNTVPFDPRKPFDPSGIRLGTPAMTSRGMKEPEMKRLAQWMHAVLSDIENETRQDEVAAEIREFCKDFPAPGLPR